MKKKEQKKRKNTEKAKKRNLESLNKNISKCEETKTSIPVWSIVHF